MYCRRVDRSRNMLRLLLSFFLLFFSFTRRRIKNGTVKNRIAKGRQIRVITFLLLLNSFSEELSETRGIFCERSAQWILFNVPRLTLYELEIVNIVLLVFLRYLIVHYVAVISVIAAKKFIQQDPGSVSLGLSLSFFCFFSFFLCRIVVDNKCSPIGNSVDPPSTPRKTQAYVFFFLLLFFSFFLLWGKKSFLLTIVLVRPFDSCKK